MPFRGCWNFVVMFNFVPQKLFSTLEVVGASEMNLAANQWKEDMERFDWKISTGTQL